MIEFGLKFVEILKNFSRKNQDDVVHDINVCKFNPSSYKMLIQPQMTEK